MSMIHTLLANDEIWFQLFDTIRLIEPGGTHRVIQVDGKETQELNAPCYCYWGREEHCANCVSKRAHSKRKPVMKLEYRKNGYYCVIARPVEVENKEYILELIMNISEQILDDQEDDYVKTIMKDLSERLDKASSTDSFTGLFNKEHMREMYTAYMQDEGRRKIYMALLDMDDFKGVNDRYGHDLGDAVLLNVAKLLRQTVGREGTVARFGGDEFGILFVGQDEAQCRRILREIEKSVESAEYEGEEENFRSGISYGLADVTGTEDFYEAIHIVDKQLYQHKRERKK